MIHQFSIYGNIKRINVTEPKDPKKNPSAIIMVQYGGTREATGRPVEFINAVMVRVPNYQYPRVKDQLVLDATVHIQGHLQGVYKSTGADTFFTTELVADVMNFDSLGFNVQDEKPDPAAAA